MDILLLTPPMTQVNTPYPATAYLTGFLRSRGFVANQVDLSIGIFMRLFCAQGLDTIQAHLSTSSKVKFFMQNFQRYQDCIDPVVRFLQGKDPSLATRICSRNFLPEGPRFKVLNDLEKVFADSGDDGQAKNSMYWAFGSLGVIDQGKYLASLFIDDIADVIRNGIDPNFSLARYGEKLAASTPTFEPILKILHSKNPSLVAKTIIEETKRLIATHKPPIVALSMPFPGNVLGAFIMAKTIKEHAPDIQIIMGGGYVNTELRQLSDTRVFDYIDYLCFDDGERPLLAILENLRRKNATPSWLRTAMRKNQKIVMCSDPKLHDIPQKEIGTPTYDGLPLDQYLSLVEMLNPMHRLWSDGRWNKLTLAHGCYWKKCRFCDTSLDYIERYDPVSADIIIDRMLALIAETGQRGFHFVDEAAPPQILFSLARRLLERRIVVTWWGNIRFEKSFNRKTVELLAASGCVAVSGGLEVASDRLLKMMDKGVTVDQVARVSHHFSSVGILVHAYLMYGFPTQTTQETIDALERVRQLFTNGCIQSGFWHRFAATVHSPIGKNPEKYGIQLSGEPPGSFANNDLGFIDATPCDHEMLGVGLRKAIYNYMIGIGLDWDVRSWFEQKVPKAKVPASLIKAALR